MKEILFEKQSNGCIYCTSHCMDDFGYTRVKRNNKPTRLHRHLYEQQKGEIPRGMVVRHTCDDPRCCNIDHLVIGTQKDNVQDMISRHRNYSHNELGKRLRGENNGQSKLSECMVIEIFNSRLGYKELAELYNVSKTTISNIKNQKYWEWLTNI